MISIIQFLKTIVPEKIKNAIRSSGIYRSARTAIDAQYMHKWSRLKNKRAIRKSAMQPGVNLVGFLDSSLGLGAAARSLQSAMLHAGVKINPVSIDQNIPGRKIHSTSPHRREAFADYAINLIHVNPPEYPLIFRKMGEAALVNRYTIGAWYWELPQLPGEWSGAFQVLDEIWVASDFVRETVLKESPIPVYKIPPCIQVEVDKKLTRKDFALPDEVFLFINAFDARSISERKNPIAAIQAFTEAFGEGDDTVGLVVKVSNADYDPPTMEQLEKALQKIRHGYLLSSAMSLLEFHSLIHLVDACISLHRSEGFGLIPAEAMALGKPVIMTRWSGNLEYMNEENSCGVDYHLIPVEKGLVHYRPGTVWADPDLEHAASFLKKIRIDRSYYRMLSMNARKTIVENFSPEKIGDLVKQRIHEILQDRNLSN